MKKSVAMYLYIHMHASMQKRVFRTPRIHTFAYLKYYVYIYIYIYMKESVAILYLYIHIPSTMQKRILRIPRPIPLHI